MDVLWRKSPFCPELTQILDFEKTETHNGKSFIMAHSIFSKHMFANMNLNVKDNM